MQYFFDTKTNFFQLRKIFTREYIKHSGTHSKSAFFACFIPPNYTNKQQREKEDHFNNKKIRGAVCGKVCYFLKIKGGAF